MKNQTSAERLDKLLDEIRGELKAEYLHSGLHSDFNSKYEGYAFIKEELDELWAEIKTTETSEAALFEKTKRVVVMAVKFMVSLRRDATFSL